LNPRKFIQHFCSLPASSSVSHAEKLRLALEELTNVKEKEKENAVKSVQQEMQSLVDTAYAARDDYLALYTKVVSPGSPHPPLTLSSLCSLFLGKQATQSSSQ
jgi:mevalonate kinase